MLKVNTQGRGTHFFAYSFLMSDSGAKPERCWQEITADAAQEPTPEKLVELSDELALALEQRKKILNSKVKSDKSNPIQKTG